VVTDKVKREKVENGFYADTRLAERSKERGKINPEIVGAMKRDYNILELSTSNLFQEDNMWVIRGEDVETSSEAKSLELFFTQKPFYSLLNEVGLSKRMLNRLPIDLVRHNYEALKGTKSRVIVERDNNIVTNVFDPEANFMPIEHLLASLNEEFNEVLVSDSAVRLLSTIDSSFDVAKNVGDIHHMAWAFDIFNGFKKSRLTGALSIFRLSCTNGMVGMGESSRSNFSKNDEDDYRSGVGRFMRESKARDFSELIKKITARYQALHGRLPTNENLIEVFKTCRSIVDADFGDSVIGWTEDFRKDSMKLASVKNEGIEFVTLENGDYGTCFDILNRITDLGKEQSVMSQIELSDYSGKILTKGILN